MNYTPPDPGDRHCKCQKQTDHQQDHSYQRIVLRHTEAFRAESEEKTCPYVKCNIIYRNQSDKEFLS